MILTLYGVKDELADRFLNPVLMNSEAEAKRQFKSQINTLPIWKDNSGDFSLWRLGTFDDQNGLLLADPEKLINGRSVRDA